MMWLREPSGGAIKACGRTWATSLLEVRGAGLEATERLAIVKYLNRRRVAWEKYCRIGRSPDRALPRNCFSEIEFSRPQSGPDSLSLNDVATIV
jgi:hypothetical protein